MRAAVSLSLCAQLVFAVSISEANYGFTVRFYEFRNPLGLQCGECGSGGQPACCDDVERKENCSTIAPCTCDTRIRFLLRPFGSSVNTAPNTGYRYFTPSNGGNSEMFSEGPGGLLGLQNPFTFNCTEIWTGRIQFHVDVTDRPIPVSSSGINETLAIINRFPINLELHPGPEFTERTSYTGIYSIPDLGFDMSFRVQCSENYYGPNCTTFCEAIEEVYRCDGEGRHICLVQSNRDSTTNCTTCLPGYDPSTNCTECLAGRDMNTTCVTCLMPGYDPTTNCTQCLTGRDANTDCTTCLPGYDPTTNCTQCLMGRDQTTNCTTCLRGYDPSTNCTTQTTTTIAVTDSVTVVILILGGLLGLSAVINIVLLITVVILAAKRRGKDNNIVPSLSPKATSVSEGDDGTKDIEMKPNSLYGVTSNSERIVTKPNEVYGVSNHPMAYEYVNP